MSSHISITHLAVAYSFLFGFLCNMAIDYFKRSQVKCQVTMETLYIDEGSLNLRNFPLYGFGDICDDLHDILQEKRLECSFNN